MNNLSFDYSSGNYSTSVVTLIITTVKSTNYHNDLRTQFNLVTI